MSSVVVHEIASASEGPYALALTADGALWCTLVHTGEVLRLAPPLAGGGGGAVTRIPLGEGSQAAQIAAAGDDTVWVTDPQGDRVVLVGPAGVLRSIDAPTPGAQPYGVVSLHDGTAWFTGLGNDSLGRIDILGGVAEFSAGTADGMVSMIAASGDSLWFTANRANAVGYVRGGDSAPVLHPLPTPDAGPVGITVADDGAAWFCEILAGRIGRVDRRGTVTEHPLPDPASKPHAIVASASGDGCWFTLWGSNQLGHIALDGAVELIDLAPSGHDEPHGLVATAAGTVWVAMESGALLEVTS